MIVFGPVVLCVVGLFLYVLATKPEVKEIGRIAFGVCLLAAMLRYNEIFAVFGANP